MYRGEKPIETALAPLGFPNDIARHAVDIWLSTEDLPDADNRVTVDKQGNITLNYTPNNQVPKQKLYDKLKSMLQQIGMHPATLLTSASTPIDRSPSAATCLSTSSAASGWEM
jgi:hypothetical protein